MSVNVKALRALLDAWDAAIESGPSSKIEDAYNAVTDAVMEDVDQLIALAEAVRELQSVIARIADPNDASIDVTNDEYHAARRVLAILDPTNAGDGR